MKARELFKPNESPYFNMYTAGLSGIPFEECVAVLTELGVPIRGKDAQSWQDGDWKRRMKAGRQDILNPVVQKPKASTIVATKKLSDFPMIPYGWLGTDRRWFPCSFDNMPLQRWGYKPEEDPPVIPELFDRPTAQALSPCGWVGQNLYGQTFVVMDIDGRGHGEDDEQVIMFGNQFRNLTETWEDPAKPGSFHLYFSTDRYIPIAHFPEAKLDFLGNQTNAAVYTKNKQPNGLPRMMMTDAVWDAMQHYVKVRKMQKRGGASEQHLY